jgi:hypothetical protein
MRGELADEKNILDNQVMIDLDQEFCCLAIGGFPCDNMSWLTLRSADVRQKQGLETGQLPGFWEQATSGRQ